MNDDDRIAIRLKALPPETPIVPARFEQVAVRVRHRRRVNASLMFAAVLLIALPAALLVVRGTSTDPRVPVATDPTPARTTPSSEPSQGASDQAPLPGSDRIDPLSEPVTVTRTGTATVDLGRRPGGATAVSVALDCLSPGRFIWPNGGSMTCSQSDFSDGGDPSPGVYPAMKLKPNQTEIVIRGDDGASWQVTTYYVSSVPTPWGVNAKGETYGVEKGNRRPDLIGVVATNGKTGYAYAADLDGPNPNPTLAEVRKMQRDDVFDEPIDVPVYESDGETRIGTFTLSVAEVRYGDDARDAP